MSKEGHYYRMKRPTEKDLYEDARRILDELLEKQRDDKRKVLGKPQRTITDPFPSVRRPITAGDVLDERAEQGLDGGINRSQTMPARPRPSRDGKSKQSNLDRLKKLIDEGGHSPGASAASSEASAASSEASAASSEASAASSEASDGESSLVSENREKKSLFRRAKDRLRHAFHRQEREHKMKVNDGEKDSRKTDRLSKKTSPKGHKLKKSKLTDSQRGSPNSIGVSRPDKQSPIKDKQNSSSKDSKDKREHSVNSEDEKRRHTMDSKSDPHLVLGEISSGRRNSTGRSFLHSIRKSFSGGKKHRPTIPAGFQETNSGHGLSDRSLPLPSPPSSDKSSTPSPVNGASGTTHPLINGESHNSLGPPVAHPHDKSPSPYPHSSSTDSHYGHRSSSINSHLSTGSKNILDDPGDDIRYMDEADSGCSGPVPSAQRSKIIVDNGHHKINYGKHHPRLLQQSSLAEDGESDSPDGNGKPEGMDSLVDNVPLHERTHEEKEEMYGEIAHKLIGMADSYAAERGVSESESRRDRGSQAASHLQTDRGEDGLTDLERQIVACLRRLGDRSPTIGPQENAVVEEVKTEMYERFKKTVQHSLGNEVSWNHLAFLFYATKGVVSALGRGTQAAASAKEMTLRYVTDRCAKWIMDQGGFDSVLSDDSDSNLD